MRERCFLAFLLQVAIVVDRHAAGPFGNVHVGNWKGGAFTDDNTGAFSHCAATTTYGNGVILVVGQNASQFMAARLCEPQFPLHQGRPRFRST